MTKKQVDEAELKNQSAAAEPEAEETANQTTENAEKVNQPTEEKPVDPEEEALNIRFMRLSADFANFKKRVEKEKADIYRLGNEKLMLELLPVLDNIDRALDHADESPKEKFVEGVEMILNSLMNVLINAGLKEIEAEGKPFDHNAHHAVLTEESDEYDSDTVTAVLQKGYKLNDKVIRPAMVKVSK